jgi:hypothetical protein
MPGKLRPCERDRQAATGTQPWARLWRAGHGRAWRADLDYIAKREDTWHHALLD